MKEVLGQAFKFLFGGSGGLFIVLVAAVILDFITGICLAIYQKKLSSKVGYKGISKKIAIFALVAVSNVIDVYLLDAAGVLSTVCTVFYISNECISIIENSAEMGVPIPEKLKNALDVLKKKN